MWRVCMHHIGGNLCIMWRGSMHHVEGVYASHGGGLCITWRGSMHHAAGGLCIMRREALLGAHWGGPPSLASCGGGLCTTWRESVHGQPPWPNPPGPTSWPYERVPSHCAPVHHSTRSTSHVHLIHSQQSIPFVRDTKSDCAMWTSKRKNVIIG